ncbi:MAG: endopeptidase La [Candidatus Yanofskybacteria bacterium]|nr:endopeptidase La [Candidatus Yanofskybacteria bacterium]
MPEFRINNTTISDHLPLIALKNTVLFPKVVIPLIVQRPKSVAALEAAVAGDRMVLFTTQKNVEDDISENDLFSVGTVGRVISVFRLPDGSAKVDVEGVCRARVVEYAGFSPFFQVQIEPMVSTESMDTPENSALLRRVLEQFKHVAEVRSFPAILPEVVYLMTQLRDPEQIIGLVAANLNLDVRQQQDILEMREHSDAMRQLNVYLGREMEVLEAEKSIARETKKKIGRMQKEFFLREQLKNIEKELGVDEERDELDGLRAKIEAAKMPPTVHEKAMKEFGRLAKMPPMSPETGFIRTYLDWLIEIPWNETTKDKIDLAQAKKVLDEDHAGLEKVKDRILEYLAVQKQVGKVKGPILCFYGPPGTGKTSIGQSIARALDRKFVRVSLGGMRDEAEIRGHRRTYVGAMPGRIVQGVHTAKVRNPVFLLDEIDKLGMDFRGDPSAALLEALDPQQNHAFSDHYLEMPLDLSDVLFIATANSLETIPPALRDRLEIIDFPGYTEQEKLRIAKGFLLPKALTDHGLKKGQVNISDAVLLAVIRDYTRESGVRELSRLIGTVARKVIRRLVEEGKTSRKVSVTRADLEKMLGPEKVVHDVAERSPQVGFAMGLAWTPVGGELLPIEVARMPGKGKLILTGQLGEVMRESAQAALSYARAYAAREGVLEDLAKEDLHIHLPSGAIKKDGPSAGIALTTALVSLFLKRPIRHDVAMTGEVTLRGKVGIIGGLKEKALAALRAGITTIIIPTENQRDLADMPAEAKKKLRFVPVKTVDEVFAVALKGGRTEKKK